MGVEIRKKKGESTFSLIRRFTQAVQNSGILVRARQIQFRDRNISEEKKKRKALYREQKKQEYERMKKLGLLP